jgi:hypothetical protein
MNLLLMLEVTSDHMLEIKKNVVLEAEYDGQHNDIQFSD